MNSLLSSKVPVTNRIVVRLKTSYWGDSKGLHVKRDLIYLKRKCLGFNGLSEDACCGGANTTIQSITNLDDCPDGIYEVGIVDGYRDWETGIIEEWTWRLIPYEDDDNE